MLCLQSPLLQFAKMQINMLPLTLQTEGVTGTFNWMHGQ